MVGGLQVPPTLQAVQALDGMPWHTHRRMGCMMMHVCVNMHIYIFYSMYISMFFQYTVHVFFSFKCWVHQKSSWAAMLQASFSHRPIHKWVSPCVTNQLWLVCEYWLNYPIHSIQHLTMFVDFCRGVHHCECTILMRCHAAVFVPFLGKTGSFSCGSLSSAIVVVFRRRFPRPYCLKVMVVSYDMWSPRTNILGS